MAVQFAEIKGCIHRVHLRVYFYVFLTPQIVKTSQLVLNIACFDVATSFSLSLHIQSVGLYKLQVVQHNSFNGNCKLSFSSDEILQIKGPIICKRHSMCLLPVNEPSRSE